MKKLAIFTLAPAPLVWILERFHTYSFVLLVAIPIALILAVVVFAKTKEDQKTRKLAKISMALNSIAIVLIVVGAIMAIRLRETIKQHPEWLQQSEQPTEKK